MFAYYLPGDIIGFSFMFTAILFVAISCFLILARSSVSTRWHLPLAASTILSIIGALSYYLLSESWITTGTIITELRYMDWLISIPLWCICIYLTLRATGIGTRDMLYRIGGFSVGMVSMWYLGETLLIQPLVAIGVGIVFWGVILFDVWYADIAKTVADSAHLQLKSTYKHLKWLLLLGIGGYPTLHIIGIIFMQNLHILAYTMLDITLRVYLAWLVFGLARSDSQRSE